MLIARPKRVFATDAADGEGLQPSPKRARKKQARDERVARIQAAYRRRRIARVAGIALALAAVAGLMMYVTQQRNNDGDSEQRPAASSSTPRATPCPRVDVPETSPQQYDAPPGASTLKAGVDYSADVRTSCGTIEIDLLEESAPENVASFVFLAREGFFDGLPWHRIERNFVIQTGDPNGLNGTPPDDAGYKLPDELEGTEKKDYTFGTVGMANPGVRDSAGSQWFIVVHSRDKKEHAGLDPLYTIFGRVSGASYDVIETISRQPVEGGTDPRTASEPIVPVYIESIEIAES
jgi:cyclophilin family peptidyl-prolyl cis-trans isomerase